MAFSSETSTLLSSTRGKMFITGCDWLYRFYSVWTHRQMWTFCSRQQITRRSNGCHTWKCITVCFLSNRLWCDVWEFFFCSHQEDYIFTKYFRVAHIFFFYCCDEITYCVKVLFKRLLWMLRQRIRATREQNVWVKKSEFWLFFGKFWILLEKLFRYQHFKMTFICIWILT